MQTQLLPRTRCNLVDLPTANRQQFFWCLRYLSILPPKGSANLASYPIPLTDTQSITHACTSRYDELIAFHAKSTESGSVFFPFHLRDLSLAIEIALNEADSALRSKAVPAQHQSHLDSFQKVFQQYSSIISTLPQNSPVSLHYWNPMNCQAQSVNYDPNLNITVPEQFLEKLDEDLDVMDNLFFKINGHHFSEFNPSQRWYNGDDLQEDNIFRKWICAKPQDYENSVKKPYGKIISIIEGKQSYADLGKDTEYLNDQTNSVKEQIFELIKGQCKNDMANKFHSSETKNRFTLIPSTPFETNFCLGGAPRTWKASSDPFYKQINGTLPYFNAAEALLMPAEAMDCFLFDLEPNFELEGKSLEEIYRQIQLYFPFPLSDQRYAMLNPLTCLIVSMMDYLLEFKIRLVANDSVSEFSAFSATNRWIKLEKDRQILRTSGKGKMTAKEFQSAVLKPQFYEQLMVWTSEDLVTKRLRKSKELNELYSWNQELANGTAIKFNFNYDYRLTSSIAKLNQKRNSSSPPGDLYPIFPYFVPIMQYLSTEEPQKYSENYAHIAEIYNLNQSVIKSNAKKSQQNTIQIFQMVYGINTLGERYIQVPNFNDSSSEFLEIQIVSDGTLDIDFEMIFDQTTSTMIISEIAQQQSTRKSKPKKSLRNGEQYVLDISVALAEERTIIIPENSLEKLGSKLKFKNKSQKYHASSYNSNNNVQIGTPYLASYITLSFAQYFFVISLFPQINMKNLQADNVSTIFLEGRQGHLKFATGSTPSDRKGLPTVNLSQMLIKYSSKEQNRDKKFIMVNPNPKDDVLYIKELISIPQDSNQFRIGALFSPNPNAEFRPSQQFWNLNAKTSFDTTIKLNSFPSVSSTVPSASNGHKFVFLNESLSKFGKQGWVSEAKELMIPFGGVLYDDSKQNQGQPPVLASFLEVSSNDPVGYSVSIANGARNLGLSYGKETYGPYRTSSIQLSLTAKIQQLGSSTVTQRTKTISSDSNASGNINFDDLAPGEVIIGITGTISAIGVSCLQFTSEFDFDFQGFYENLRLSISAYQAQGDKMPIKIAFRQ